MQQQQQQQQHEFEGSNVRAAAASGKSLFLGLDMSTQSLKAVFVDAGDLSVVHSSALNFDEDLPQFKTKGGVHTNGSVVTTPPALWAAALESLLGRLQRSADVSIGRVVALSISGQQHGSVYWARGGEGKLRALDGNSRKSLVDQLHNAFAIDESPTWMDASTQAECQRREAAAGGALPLARMTGSRAYERFTGNQIAKIAAASQGTGLHNVERISLVSSFVSSLLLGKYAPLDTSDASGMNLMDINTRDWAPNMLDVTIQRGDKTAAVQAMTRLLGGAPVKAHMVVGTVHRFWQQRFGFRPETEVISASGDNPCSLAGLGMSEPGDLAISLGTSDTLFGVSRCQRLHLLTAVLLLQKPCEHLCRSKMPESDSKFKLVRKALWLTHVCNLTEQITTTPAPGLEGSVFVNPLDPIGSYMAMLVFANGGRARQAVRDRYASGNWAKFTQALASTPPGNGGKVGLYLEHPEITPRVYSTASLGPARSWSARRPGTAVDCTRWSICARPTPPLV